MPEIPFDIILYLLAVTLVGGVTWFIVFALNTLNQNALISHGYEEVSYAFNSHVLDELLLRFQFFHRKESVAIGLALKSKFRKYRDTSYLPIDSEAYFLPLRSDVGSLIVFHKDLVDRKRLAEFPAFDETRQVFKDTARADIKKLIIWLLKKDKELEIEMNHRGILFFYRYSPLSIEQRITKAESLHALFKEYVN